eukprot:comp10141_c0_seq1/m.4977 comp10141_c0_seq1/g.4977  ORF comp10141_c0_seq1/g.4977 comp10141_c0_seq1/m.4977 type:complete len:434 (-) comp10141_c0_seq1:85-1386(-)
MISALFFFNFKGDVLISRVYRGSDVGRSAADAFRVHVIHSRHQVRSPVMTIGHTTFFHINVDNVWVCAVTRQNVNAALVFEFLRKIVDIFKNYFGRFNEDAIKNNFVLMYELLDEVLDFGYPQRTEADILKLYITQEGVKVQRSAEVSSITMQATGATTWRREGIKYRKNEIFIDVIETVSMLMSSQGKELNADVTGSVMMKCFLSGMPECKFGLNDKLSLERRDRSKGAKTPGKGGIEIDDIQFHQAVRLGAQADKGVSFIPPDGEFELMRYRTTSNIKTPFRVIPIVRDIGKTRIEAKIVVKSLYNNKMVANGVEVRFPTPTNTATVHMTCTNGKARYKAGENAIVWKMKKLPGESEVQLSAEIDLIVTTEKRERQVNKAPIKMQFQVPMFTASGMQVRFLKVLEPKLGYETVKWVRYVTKAGQFETRIQN